MMGRIRVWIGGGVLLAASLCASTVFAQNGPGHPARGSNGSLGFYGFGYYDYMYNPAHIPHYALYPPVYYSYVVPRPYGYSPFAYPPGVMTPEMEVKPSGAMFRNPFVPPRTEPKPASSNKTAAVGKMFRNPFVRQAEATASVSLAERTE